MLVDLPIGNYFRKFLDTCVAVIGSDDNRNAIKKDVKFISDLMKDFKAEKIKNLLKKIWISEFHRYCMTNLNDTSKTMMNDILKFESDCMTIQIIYNSIDIKGLSDAKGREGERKKYINNLGKLHSVCNFNYVGYLYPDRDRELTEADTFEKLRDAVKGFPYEQMISQVTDVPSREKASEFSSSGKSIGKIFYTSYMPQ